MSKGGDLAIVSVLSGDIVVDKDPDPGPLVFCGATGADVFNTDRIVIEDTTRKASVSAELRDPDANSQEKAKIDQGVDPVPKSC